jgi:hypothetical protein
MTTAVIVTVPDAQDSLVVRIECIADPLAVQMSYVDTGDDEPSALYDELPSLGTDNDRSDVHPVADPW